MKRKPFIRTQRQKNLFMNQTLIMRLNQYVTPLWQKYKKVRQKTRVGLLTQ